MWSRLPFFARFCYLFEPLDARTASLFEVADIANYIDELSRTAIVETGDPWGEGPRVTFGGSGPPRPGRLHRPRRSRHGAFAPGCGQLCRRLSGGLRLAGCQVCACLSCPPATYTAKTSVACRCFVSCDVLRLKFCAGWTYTHGHQATGGDSQQLHQ